ncbi:adhesion G protein-coupled receptor E5 isoform X3 [Nycticebus coucang]|uniref:adhesion G protein-coupled receptor E5 isoform X3 n=1 Tax=Nycticebus coucang TaxID=9470 RepID=UPI00234CC5B6|nr:adhesion G protein-coupled receptor E5 isoform X3 [Nycticebus coucang]
MGGSSGSGIVLVLYVFLLTLSGAESQNSRACAQWCPPNAMCVNATACRCKPGFSSSSEEIFSDPTGTCDDINECTSPGGVDCGKFADCQNVEGSYYCSCIPGYGLTSGAESFQNKSENTCQDMDECQQSPRVCRSHGICSNTPGSYTCQCPPGFVLKPEDPKLCTDMDECSSRQHLCHKSAVCVNTVGSYTCHCRPGWKPKAGVPTSQKSPVCEELPFANLTLPLGVNSQALSHFFNEVQKLGKDTDKDTIQNFIRLVDELIEAPGDMENLAPHERHYIVTWLLFTLEEVLRALAKTMPQGPFTYCSPSNTELSLLIQEKGVKNVTMGQSHARMLLNWAVAAGARDSGPTVAGIFSSKNLAKLLANASLDLDPEKQAQLELNYERPVSGAQVHLLSAVNSVFLSNTNTEKLASPITFAFTHLEMPKQKHQELICAFWKRNSNGSGHWATMGCQKMGSQNNTTTCQCHHLSSFAILMAHYDVQDWKLAMITKVGLALSLVCLLLCILTFLLVRPIQGSRTTIHLHLCICLFVGSAIFLAGIENEGGEVGLRCRLVAGLLHYCFLAAFCWMSLEGLELYFLVVRVFQGQSLSTRWLCLIGYGVPLSIVAISVAISVASHNEGYGRPSFCWLGLKHGFLWSFLGPLIFIISCNAVIFVTTIWKLTQKFSEINPDMKKLKKARVLTITAIAQLFVLGCTWVFGLFIFEKENWLWAYIFTILNCLQGLFLYVLHCLLNRKVREEYGKWACLVAGNKYSEFASSSSNTSHNQTTRALRASESGM